MKTATLQKLGFLIVVLSFCLHFYVEKQNQLTKVKIQIPKLVKEIQLLKEESRQFLFQIDRFENPYHLMEMARMPQYSHLKHPFLENILTLPQGVAINQEEILTQEVPFGVK